MTIDTNDLINSIMKSFQRINYIRPDDIPNIDLYMDQVTTFMESSLKQSTRNPEEDKVLTKTMINNYAKNDLLPPPIKKKYSKDHIMMLIFIYYYKGILSINDIQTLLKPISDNFFGKEGYSLEQVYAEIVNLEKAQTSQIQEDILEKFKIAENTFENAPEENKEYLELFAFISLLGYDVYVKQLLIEKIIDGYKSERGEESPE